MGPESLMVGSSSSSSVVRGGWEEIEAALETLSSASLPALVRRPLRMRVVEAEDEGRALDRMLLTRETAALELADVEVEVEEEAGAACRGVGALIGVVDADGAAAGGLVGGDICEEGIAWCGRVEASGCEKPVSIAVGEAKRRLSSSAEPATCVGGSGCCDIVLAELDVHAKKTKKATEPLVAVL